MLPLFALLSLTSTAQAVPMALDPQSKLHLGVNFVQPGPSGVGPSFGVAGGFESRLTRYATIDVGGFVSPADLEPQTVDTREDAFVLRNGLYITPGFRIPHKQPKGWAYDLQPRIGGGVVSVADIDPLVQVTEESGYDRVLAPAAVAGGDIVIRSGSLGVKLGGKAWGISMIPQKPPEAYFVVRSQFSLEGIIQW